MRTLRHVLLWLVCLALTPFLITYAYGQSVGTYVQSATGNTVNAQGVTGVPRYAVAPTDCGGTVTTGGTSQTVTATNLTRTYLYIQNPIAATEPITIKFNAAATLPNTGNSYEIAPGGTFTLQGNDGSMFTGTVMINATTAGHRYVCFTN